MAKTPSVLIVSAGSCQTSYFTGEYFDPTGVVVTVRYTDGTRKTVTYYLYSPTSPLSPSNTYITFSYTESGVTVSANLSITVVDPGVPSSLWIYSSPNEYLRLNNQYAGEPIDLYGLNVRVYFTNGTSELKSAALCTLKINNVSTNILSQGTNIVQLSFTQSDVTVTASFSLTANLPERQTYESSFLDDIKWNMSNLEMAYTQSLISFNKNGHPLEAFITFHPHTLNRIKEQNPELPSNWVLSFKQFLVFESPKYKYINELGEVITFEKLTDTSYYDTDQKGLLLTINSPSSGYKTILFPDGTQYIFNSDNRLIRIEYFGSNGLVLEIVYQTNNTNLIDRIRYNNNQNTYLLFNYNSGNLLTSISAYSNSNKANQTFINYTSGKITSISIRGNSDNNTPLTLVTFSYNSNSLINVIKNAQTNEAFKLTYSQYRITDACPLVHHLNEIEKGVYVNNAFQTHSKLTKQSYTCLATTSTSIHESVIKNEKDISISYFSDSYGKLQESFENVNGNYKSLTKHKGINVSISNQSTTNNPTINGFGYYSLNSTSSYSINSSTAIDTLTKKNGLSLGDFTLSLSFYIKYSVSSSQIPTITLHVGNTAYKRKLDNTLNDIYQRITIPFVFNSGTSSTLSFHFTNQNGQALSASIFDLVIDYSTYETMIYKSDNNTILDFKEFNYIKKGYSYYEDPVTLSDILMTLRAYSQLSSDLRLVYLNGGKKVIYESNISNITYRIGSNSLPLQDLLNYFYVKKQFIRFDKYENSDTGYGYSIIDSSHYQFSSNQLVISETNENTKSYNGCQLFSYVSKSSSKTYDLYSRLTVEMTSISYGGITDTETTQYSYNAYGDVVEIKKTTPSSGNLIIESNTYDSDGQPYYIDGPISGNHLAFNYNKDVIGVHPRIFTSSTMSTLANVTNDYQRDIYYRSLNNIFSISNQPETYNSNTYDSNGLIKDIINSGSIGYRILHSDDLKTTSRYSIVSSTPTLLESETLTLPTLSTAYETFLSKSWSIGAVDHSLTQKYDEYNRFFSLEYDDETQNDSYSFATRKESSFANNDLSQICGLNNYLKEFDYYTNQSAKEERIFVDGNALLKKKYNNMGSLMYHLFPTDINFSGTVSLFISPSYPGIEETINSVDSLDVSTAHYVYNYDLFHRLTDKTQASYSAYYNTYNSYIYSYLTKDGRNTELLSGLIYNGLKNDSNQYIYKLQDTISYDDRTCISQIVTIKTINGNSSSSTRTFTYDDFLRIASSIYANYSYNSNGLMSTESNSTHTKSYSYNSSFFGQISSIVITDTSSQTSETYTFSYDALGNRTGKTFNNVTTTYSYYYHFLNTISDNSKTISFKYGPNGIRYKKTVTQNNVDTITKYIYDDTKLIALQTGNWKLIFFYDMHGVCGFKALANSSYGVSEDRVFTYIRNELGDVVSILNEGGSEVISYTYNEWGNIVTSSNISTDYSYYFALKQINPFRYRGYIYDEETGLYYLNTRYYDPFIHTFLTIDDYKYLDISNITGINLYCYCSYNPVMYKDENGNSFIGTLLISAAIGAIAGGLLGGAFGALTAAATGGDIWTGIWTGALGGAIAGAGAGIASMFLGIALAGESVSLALGSYIGMSTGELIMSGLSISYVTGVLGGATQNMLPQLKSNNFNWKAIDKKTILKVGFKEVLLTQLVLF